MNEHKHDTIIPASKVDAFIESCLEASKREEAGVHSRDYALWNIAQGVLAYMIRERMARYIASGED